jgi:hypothetical protein
MNAAISERARLKLAPANFTQVSGLVRLYLQFAAGAADLNASPSQVRLLTTLHLVSITDSGRKDEEMDR